MVIAVSACLLGENCKYNGGNNYNLELSEFLKDYDVIKVCPEMLGGLSVPRVPAEILNGNVINKEGIDITNNYVEGAKKTLSIALENDIKVAILKKNSPSCGMGMIYDGTFSHTLVSGDGIAAKLLKENGIRILNEENYKEYFKKYE